jgi:hypothetical protein
VQADAKKRAARAARLMLRRAVDEQAREQFLAWLDIPRDRRERFGVQWRNPDVATWLAWAGGF